MKPKIFWNPTLIWKPNIVRCFISGPDKRNNAQAYLYLLFHFFFLGREPVPLNFRVLEGLWISAAPYAEIVVGNHRVEVHRHVHVLEVSLLGGVAKLSMIPVEDANTVGLALAQVIRQVVANPRPEQRRNPSDRWHVVLINIVEYLVVERYQIFELRFGQSRLRRRYIGEGVKDQDLSVLLLDPLEQHHYAVHHGTRQMGIGWLRVTTPTTYLGEHELYKYRQGTLRYCVRH